MLPRASSPLQTPHPPFTGVLLNVSFLCHQVFFSTRSCPLPQKHATMAHVITNTPPAPRPSSALCPLQHIKVSQMCCRSALFSVHFFASHSFPNPLQWVFTPSTPLKLLSRSQKVSCHFHLPHLRPPHFLVTPSAFASRMLILHFLASAQCSQVLSPCPKAQLWPLSDCFSCIRSAGDPTWPTAVYSISAVLTPESKGSCPLKAASPAHHLQLSVQAALQI